MKQFLKKWYRTQSIPEKHLINEVKSAISNEDIPFFIHVCVNYLLFFIAFFAVTVVIIPYLLFHYVQKILLFFILLFKHLNEERKKRNFKRNKEKQVKKILSDYEKKLLKQEGLFYLIRSDKSILLKKDFEKKCLEEFLYDFITHYNESCSTFSHYRFICSSGKRRSLGDIFLICKHYYPDCNIHEVLSILIKMLQKKDIRGASYCNTINKYVFHNQSTIWNKRDYVEYSKEIIFQDLIDVYGKK